MRLQHATQAASGLSADNPSRVQAKAVIVEEVERLRWRIWNGKATNAKRSIDRVRKVMHVYREERGDRIRSAPSRRLWHALLDVDDYLRGQSTWLVNYAKRYRAGACRNLGHRRHRQLPHQSAHEQVAADAMVTTRRRSPAPGSLRSLQCDARLGFRSTVSGARQPERANRQGRMIPQSLDTPSANSGLASRGAATPSLTSRPTADGADTVSVCCRR
jgi:hypothetical protein